MSGSRCTSATPAGVPRSRSRWTRRERAEIRRDREEVEAQARAYHELYGDDDEPWGDPEDDYCYTCHCRGYLTVCCDDLCHGAGECIHGDGDVMCPDCQGRWL